VREVTAAWRHRRQGMTLAGTSARPRAGRWRDSTGSASRHNEAQAAPAFNEGETVADSSFDIVSKIDKQEVANAVNQAAKEISSRYDFKNVGASVELSGESIVMKANSEERTLAVLDVLQTKLVKRGVSLKTLDYGDDEPTPKLSGKEYRLEAKLKEGISSENAKKISKIIRDEGPKSVKARIEGDELRVTSKSRDDLQEVQALLKGSDLDVALQFTNYR